MVCLIFDLGHYHSDCAPVLDLPQLYQKPPTDALLKTLNMLELKPTNFSSEEENLAVHPEGVTSYLTRIVASLLDWLPSESDRESIWNAASHCLAQRSGRTAVGDMTRKFQITNSSGEHVYINLFEPGLTGDDLGHKTWSTSYELANVLYSLDLGDSRLYPENLEILELGAGTGLAGLAAACVWSTQVLQTDLRAVMSNLERNIDANAAVLEDYCGGTMAGILDWNKPEKLLVLGNNSHQEPWPEDEKFRRILAADPIYSPDHPAMLARTVAHWLLRDEDARFILAYPKREAYASQFEELHQLLTAAGLVKTYNLTRFGRDDWAATVVHEISVWEWRNEYLPQDCPAS